ncbi:hypothetical protein FNF31_01036 [Cafeteria roenbergensis]|uniref:PH domain-containing protein n=1 Tax=Cafeteria roenbergensis TaxID=33653 RepID=A0A5A8DTI1_CAFRO|nr:hypothetical protein FNF31_01036 [Cafeteria roenbergensis]
MSHAPTLGPAPPMRREPLALHGYPAQHGVAPPALLGVGGPAAAGSAPGSPAHPASSAASRSTGTPYTASSAASNPESAGKPGSARGLPFEDPEGLLGAPATRQVAAGLAGTPADAAVLQGFLRKAGKTGGSWKRRWCVLRRGGLTYFKQRDSEKPQGVIDTGSVVGLSLAKEEDSPPFAFHLHTLGSGKVGSSRQGPGRRFTLQAPSADALRHWLHAIAAVARFLRGGDVSSFEAGAKEAEAAALARKRKDMEEAAAAAASRERESLRRAQAEAPAEASSRLAGPGRAAAAVRWINSLAIGAPVDGPAGLRSGVLLTAAAVVMHPRMRLRGAFNEPATAAEAEANAALVVEVLRRGAAASPAARGAAQSDMAPLPPRPAELTAKDPAASAAAAGQLAACTLEAWCVRRARSHAQRTLLWADGILSRFRLRLRSASDYARGPWWRRRPRHPPRAHPLPPEAGGGAWPRWHGLAEQLADGVPLLLLLAWFFGVNVDPAAADDPTAAVPASIRERGLPLGCAYGAPITAFQRRSNLALCAAAIQAAGAPVLLEGPGAAMASKDVSAALLDDDLALAQLHALRRALKGHECPLPRLPPPTGPLPSADTVEDWAVEEGHTAAGPAITTVVSPARGGGDPVVVICGVAFADGPLLSDDDEDDAAAADEDDAEDYDDAAEGRSMASSRFSMVTGMSASSFGSVALDRSGLDSQFAQPEGGRSRASAAGSVAAAGGESEDAAFTGVQDDADAGQDQEDEDAGEKQEQEQEQELEHEEEQDQEQELEHEEEEDQEQEEDQEHEEEQDQEQEERGEAAAGPDATASSAAGSNQEGPVDMALRDRKRDVGNPAIRGAALDWARSKLRRWADKEGYEGSLPLDTAPSVEAVLGGAAGLAAVLEQTDNPSPPGTPTTGTGLAQRT